MVPPGRSVDRCNQSNTPPVPEIEMVPEGWSQSVGVETKVMLMH